MQPTKLAVISLGAGASQPCVLLIALVAVLLREAARVVRGGPAAKRAVLE